MVLFANRSELQIKAAVIDRLLAGSHVDADAVLISEMTVANWTRRADIVLANGRLWAFEIKSEVDSLTRLPGQIDAFQNFFEKFTVVVAQRFEQAVLTMIPDGVGVWIVDAEGGVTQRIAARQTILTKESYISLMTATELRNLLLANGDRSTASIQRPDLARRACGQPTSDLASAARDAVKRRHRSRHLQFLWQKANVGTLGAMSMLRRPRREQVPRPLDSTVGQTQIESFEIPTDHPQFLLAPGGPVLKRKRA